MPEVLDIIVVGAGLAGLATAIPTALAGHKVTVFEAAGQLYEIGAGLQITPNSSRLLQEWGLSDKLWKTAAEPTRLVVHRYSGEVLAREEAFDEKMRQRYGAPYVNLHRVDLHLALYSRARELGVTFRLGEKVDHVDFDTATVTTRAGSSAKADLVVAADGLWSRCRECFLGTSDPPLPTGDLAYRVVLTLDEIDDPYLREWVRKPAVHFWIGPGSHAVGYSLRGGGVYNIGLLIPDDLPEGVSRQPGSVEEMRALFRGWDPVLGRFLALVRRVDKWKLMHRAPLGSWVGRQGNFALVGDACHPMLPYLAQGANSAVEDGAVLGLLLGRVPARAHLPHALGLYEKVRKCRGEALARETFRQREVFHMADGPAQEARDRVFLDQLGKEPRAPFPSRWTCPEVQPWLYGYDAHEAVENALQKEPFV